MAIKRYQSLQESKMIWLPITVSIVPHRGDFNHPNIIFFDISLDTSGKNCRFMLSIKISKTDQFQKGALVVLGATDSDLCPVAALLDYLAIWGQIPDALLCLEDGRPLKHRTFTASVQQYPSSSGLVGNLVQRAPFHNRGCHHG